MHRIHGIIAVAGITLAFLALPLESAMNEPSSANLPKKPVAGAIVLFNGANLDAWQKMDDSPANWHMDGDAMVAGGGGIRTKQQFGDAWLHVEFMTPKMVATDEKKINKGNSGVYLTGRHEVQVLDSFEMPITGQSCGAIYQLHPPQKNASLPPEQWQSFDIFYRAARWKEGAVSEVPRATIYQNGVLIQDNVEITTANTGSGMGDDFVPTGPIMLQDHGHKVKFRNLWLVPMDYQNAQRLDRASPGDALVSDGVSNEKLPLAAPDGAVVLFAGTSTGAWQVLDIVDKKYVAGGGIPWKVEDDYMEVAREANKSANIRTREEFGDCRLHVEFWLPLYLDRYGQARSNSGVYLQGREEVQVLDSFGLEPADNHCGGIYKVSVPKVNGSLPPEHWQSYDIWYRAPRLDDSGQVKQSPRITVFQNGVKIQDDVEIKVAQTGGGLGGDFVAQGPILLQDHGNPIRFRNIWLVKYDDLDPANVKP